MEQAREPIPDNDEVLDAYSQTVMRVAAAVTPHVAAIEMSASKAIASPAPTAGPLIAEMSGLRIEMSPATSSRAAAKPSQNS